MPVAMLVRGDKKSEEGLPLVRAWGAGLASLEVNTTCSAVTDPPEGHRLVAQAHSADERDLLVGDRDVGLASLEVNTSCSAVTDPPARQRLMAQSHTADDATKRQETLNFKAHRELP